MCSIFSSSFMKVINMKFFFRQSKHISFSVFLQALFSSFECSTIDWNIVIHDQVLSRVRKGKFVWCKKKKGIVFFVNWGLVKFKKNKAPWYTTGFGKDLLIKFYYISLSVYYKMAPFCSKVVWHYASAIDPDVGQHIWVVAPGIEPPHPGLLVLCYASRPTTEPSNIVNY